MTWQRVLAALLVVAAPGCAARNTTPASVAPPPPATADASAAAPPARIADPSAAAAPAAIADASVTPLLARACFGCHTNEARRPWYAHLAPSSWDRGALDDLNFSAWSTYDEAQRRAAMAAIAMTVRSGAMPPRDYTFFDHAAALNDQERDVLVRWASASAAAPSAMP